MGKIYNRKNQRNVRQNLRKQEIGAEKLIWQKLRNRNHEYKFRRQYGIGNFIVDFYCPEVKLAIEIDGETHIYDKQNRIDRLREDYMRRVGAITIRYTNNDVYESRDLVIGDIIKTCDELKDKRNKERLRANHLLNKEMG